MKKLLKNKGFLVILFALLFLFPIFYEQQFVINSFCLIFLYAYWASSWNILGGYTGQMSLGHACFVGLGAYTTAVLFQHFGVSPWLGLPIAGLVAGLISLLIGIPCFRLKGSYFSLATVALCHVFRIIFNTNEQVLGFQTGAAQGMKLSWRGGLADFQFIDKRGYYVIMLCFLILIIVISYFIKNSRFGYYLAAIRTNQDAAATLGVNVMGCKLIAMFISAFFTAVGGGMYAMFIQYIDPNSVFAYDLSVKIMILAVVGGSGTLWGPVAGAALLVPIQQVLNSRLGAQLAGIATAVYGTVLMIVIFCMPKGLLNGIRDGIAGLFRRKKANPKKEVPDE